MIDVAVIGAGAAGIAAARTLAEAGRNATLIEASPRIGGRAWTLELDGMPLDLGCGWLHSGERNPLTRIAEQAGFSVDRSATNWGEQWRDLGFSAAQRDEAACAMAAFETRVASLGSSDRAADALEPGGRWNARLQAISGYINGVALEQVSAADYLAYDRAASDANWRVREGYGALVAASLPATMSLRPATPALAIRLDGGGVAIETPRGSLTAVQAIVTVSTAVLARGGLRLPAALDDRVHAAACLPLGLADKLFLALSDGHPFDRETHLVGDPRSAETGSYSVMPLGRPVIECFFGGPGAEAIERGGAGTAYAFAMDELAALIGNDVRRVLRPLAASAWARTDHVHGSYSHALPGEAGARAALAAPFEDRLFFAGEATHATDFSTAHGAWHSGVRAAQEALAASARDRRHRQQAAS